MDALKTVQALVDALESLRGPHGWGKGAAQEDALVAGHALIAQMQRDAKTVPAEWEGFSRARDAGMQPLTDPYDFWKPIRDVY